MSKKKPSRNSRELQEPISSDPDKRDAQLDQLNERTGGNLGRFFAETTYVLFSRIFQIGREEAGGDNPYALCLTDGQAIDCALAIVDAYEGLEAIYSTLKKGGLKPGDTFHLPVQCSTAAWPELGTLSEEPLTEQHA